MTNLWQCLEEIPGLVAVPAAWAAGTGDQFDALRRDLLRDAERTAKSYPCDCGCAHRVVKHDDGRIVAVCRCEPWNCDDLHLMPAQVALWKVNVPKLGRAICHAFDCVPKETPLGIAGAKQIGSFGNGTLPVVLLIRPDEESFTSAVAQLVARLPEHFILLAPTLRFQNGNAAAWLKTAKAGFFDLESHLIVLPSGKLQALTSGGKLFSPHLPKTSEPIVENQARQLFALIEKLESDRRLKNPSVMDVFRLYCIKGKTMDQIVDACKTSKGTVNNRLEDIRKATGQDPEKLRAFSPYLQNIEVSVSDARAEYIHRKTQVHGSEDTEDESK